MKYIMKFDGTEYRFLSNFYPSKMDLPHLYLDKMYGDPLMYPSVEHAYQATKTLNVEEREQIRLAATPGDTKRMGKHVSLEKIGKPLKTL